MIQNEAVEPQLLTHTATHGTRGFLNCPYKTTERTTNMDVQTVIDCETNSLLVQFPPRPPGVTRAQKTRWPPPASHWSFAAGQAGPALLTRLGIYRHRFIDYFLSPEEHGLIDLRRHHNSDVYTNFNESGFTTQFGDFVQLRTGVERHHVTLTDAAVMCRCQVHLSRLSWLLQLQLV